jgi:hypothetical protein
LFKETVCILPSKAITAERLSLGVPELLPKPGNCSSQFFEKPLRNLLSAAKGQFMKQAGPAGKFQATIGGAAFRPQRLAIGFAGGSEPSSNTAERLAAVAS